MTTTLRHFRVLLTWSWVVILVGVVVDIATESILPEPLQEYLELQYNEEWSRETLLLLGVGIPLIVAVVASYVGLYRFKRWGRTLWLWAGVVGCIVTPAFGPAIYSAWAEPIYFPETALYGVILALAYVSPVAQLIEGEPGAAPNGGPAASVDNLNAPGGPPSVS